MVLENTKTCEDVYKCLEQNKLDAAMSACEDMLKNHPENPEALHLKGVVCYQQNELENALPYLEKAVQLSPKNPHYLNTLGLLQRNLRMWDAALVTFQIALTHKPDFGQAQANMALVYLDKKEIKNALNCFEKAVPLLPDNPDVLTNYAHTLRDSGQLADSAKIYHQVLEFEPENERYLLNVGAIEMARKQEDKARIAYEKVLLKNPHEPTASHILAGLKGEHTNQAPDQYVADLFDVYAEEFDYHLASLGYEVPQMLGARIPAIMAPRAKVGAWHVLDLGCGTGACGLQFAACKNDMIGVDLSKKMLKKSAEHNIYDDLFEGSISAYFASTDKCFDLILAADVFVYIGNLETIFKDIVAHANKGALFGFSTELAPNTTDFELRTSGRYGHSDAYISKLARAYGFSTLLAKDIIVRKDAQGDLAGKLYVLQK